MKNPKAKTALKVVHRNDRAQIKRVLAASGQALLPMLELLEGAQASIDELMHESAVALVEQLLVLSAQELAGAKQRGRAGGPVLWHGAQRGVVALAAAAANDSALGVTYLPAAFCICVNDILFCKAYDNST